MSNLEKIVADVKKKMGVEVDVSAESMELLQRVMEGQVSAKEAKKALKKRLKK